MFANASYSPAKSFGLPPCGPRAPWLQIVCFAAVCGLITLPAAAQSRVVDRVREIVVGDSGDAVSPRPDDVRPLATPRSQTPPVARSSPAPQSRSKPVPGTPPPSTVSPATPRPEAKPTLSSALNPQKHVKSLAQSLNLDGAQTAAPPAKTASKSAPKTAPKSGSKSAAKYPPQLPPQTGGPRSQLDEGEHLQVRCSRPAMIFAPGDTLELAVLPNEVEVVTGQPIHCRVQVQPAASNQNIWSDDKTTTASADGTIGEVGPFKVPVPQLDGAYDLVIFFNRQEGTGKNPVATWSYVRRLQFVVIRHTNPDAAEDSRADAWKVTQELDLRATPSAAPQGVDEALISIIPGLNQPKKTPASPLGQGKLTERKFGGNTFTELPAGAWRAVSLNVPERGRPHIIEIEYPGDQPQSCAVALLEAGQPSGNGLALDRGWEVLAGGNGRTQIHRLAVWPSGTNALLVLANRDPSRPAYCGKIRVYTGGDRLTPSSLPPQIDERLVAARLDIHNLLDAFNARVVFDRDGTPVADWKTWHDAGSRLAQYLRHVGFNAAALPIAHEGGALYPSEHFPPYVDPDRGISTRGPQDLAEKDVVELLLQIFDREGLRLIPTIHFTTPLPELEKLVQEGEPGILLDLPPGLAPTDDAPAPRYNPLHPQVQEAMRKVIAEIVQRYGRHPSFGGVAIGWTADSFARFPGPHWGADELTLAQFLNDEQLEPPQLQADDDAAVILQRDPQLLPAWVRWRGAQLTGFYLRCGDELTKADRTARLYLLGGALLETPAANAGADLTRPPQTNWKGDSVFWEQGIDAELCRSQERLTLVRPQTVPSAVVHENPLDQLRPGEIDRAFTAASPDGFTAALIEHRAAMFDLATPGLDKAGVRLEQLRFVGQAGAVGSSNRRAWLDRLAAAELPALFVGGDALPLGCEDSVRDLIAAMRLLPAVPFETVSTAATEPVVVRSACSGDKRFITLVNNSPWAAAVNTTFSGAERSDLENLLTGKPLLMTEDKAGKQWRLQLRPYDYLAVAISADAKIVECRSSIDPQQLERVKREGASLRTSTQTQRTLPQPANAGFESPADAGIVPGWQLRGSAELTTEIGVDAHSGKQALHIISEQESSVFSTAATSMPFPRPIAGRFTLSFYARAVSETHSPIVRVSLEAGQSGGIVLQTRDFGRDAQSRRVTPLGRDWTLCELPVENLPADITTLRVRFVIRGAGNVWIDDLDLRDQGLSAVEREQADRVWKQFDEFTSAGRIASADRLLHSAWPEYLRRALGESPTAFQPSAPTEEPTPAATELPEATAAVAEPNPQRPTTPDSPPQQPVARPPAAAQNSAPPTPPASDEAALGPADDGAPSPTETPPQTPAANVQRLPMPTRSLELERDELKLHVPEDVGNLPPIRAAESAPPRPSARSRSLSTQLPPPPPSAPPATTKSAKSKSTSGTSVWEKFFPSTTPRSSNR